MLFQAAVRSVGAAERQSRYYAHPAVEDRHGVIAPWYMGQNGQCDFRVRVSAETLKRYPWADATKAPIPAPEYIYNGNWNIDATGTITIPPQTDWANGDFGQRAAASLLGWVDYYRYTGDPAAIAHLTFNADVLLAIGQTGPDHAWPGFLISCPTRGKSYAPSDPHGMIQLDIVAQAGLGLLRAYQCVGDPRYLDAAHRWGLLLAERRNRQAGLPPWNRYANPQDVDWPDHMTGGVVLLLAFFDELIRVKNLKADHSITAAREAGQAYLRDVLLPRWAENPTWGHHYWDWPHPVQGVIVTDGAAHYLMTHPHLFTNWQADVRNILSLFLNHSSVSPQSNGDVYSGAWAYPEGSSCCGRSLDNATPIMAVAFARYGVLAGSEWGRELARRQAILFTYDVHETGVVEDNIDGGQIIAANWFKAAHPGALKSTLDMIAWLPEVLGPNRENHIVRSSSVVRSVEYDRGAVRYTTFDAPADSIDILRLSFVPASVTCNGKPLLPRQQLDANGYHVRALPGGDQIVSIRHDGGTNVTVEGDDSQEAIGAESLSFSGEWTAPSAEATGVRRASSRGAAVEHTFKGNQVRLIGRVDPAGGLADVYLDGQRQLVGIDCWNPAPRDRQVLYFRNGLADGTHHLRVVVRGEGNPHAVGQNVYVQAVQWSAASGDADFGEGGGPSDAQRFLFGYTGRTDVMDTQGRSWRPATEFTVRCGHGTDSVATAWWTQRQRLEIAGTSDPELYRYGVHAPTLDVNFTVGPGTYHARLKFAETRHPLPEPRGRGMHIDINRHRIVSGFDIAATAGGPNGAVDLVFNDIRPENGIIDIRLSAAGGGEAIVQAIEIGPGEGGAGATGATPVSAASAPASLPR